jgi:NCAIR mutase (PurE)-related protein
MSGPPTHSDEIARRRFFAIQAARLAGAAALLVAILVVHGGIALPLSIGYGLGLIGLVLFAAVPILLARRWRTPKP